MSVSESMVSRLAALQDVAAYQHLNWDGSFEEYLNIVREDPRVCRSAFQRVYDMVISYGREEYIDSKKRVFHYPFFDSRRGSPPGPCDSARSCRRVRRAPP